jgi:hypothetical protein
MRNTTRALLPALLAVLAAATAAAQGTPTVGSGSGATGSGTEQSASTDSAKPASTISFGAAQQIPIQHFRPVDKRGINVFEAPKHDAVPYDGFKLMLGGAFLQDFQTVSHSNTADPKVVAGVNQNELADIGPGFNNAVANLYITAQLARGISVHMTSYLSSRHHSETWVKDGYLQIDDSPLDVPVLNSIMRYTTIKFGEMELNYGDSHFRRTDNGNAIYNPFVGNMIMDAFTTEAGAEIYLQHNGFLAMIGSSAGQLHPAVTNPGGRTPSFLGKLGFDRQVSDALRVRLTGSVYTNRHSTEQNLFTGDRGGSRYYFVMENTAATETGNFRSGMLAPGMSHKMTAMVVNPFVKFNGLELFGLAERAKGRSLTETVERTWNQYAVDATYRFLPGEPLYVAARYNTVSGPLAGTTTDVGASRWQVAAGWYITDNIVLKGEYITQRYNDYAPTHMLNGGKFHGFMIEGAVAF